MDITSNRKITTTAILTEMASKIRSGELKLSDLGESDFYDGDVDLLDSKVIYDYTDEEVEEFMKCQNDLLYFATTYCKIFTTNGFQKLVLTDFQIEALKNIQENKFNILNFDRQCGTNLVLNIFSLWYVTFKMDKTVQITHFNHHNGTENMAKMIDLIKGLPYFLKPRIIKHNYAAIDFYNGCKFISKVFTRNRCCWNHNITILRDARYIDQEQYEDVMLTVIPIVDARVNSKLILDKPLKIQQGIDFKISNGFWHQLPNRDEKWKQKQIEYIGSEERFNEIYNREFAKIEAVDFTK